MFDVCVEDSDIWHVKWMDLTDIIVVFPMQFAYVKCIFLTLNFVICLKNVLFL